MTKTECKLRSDLNQRTAAQTLDKTANSYAWFKKLGSNHLSWMLGKHLFEVATGVTDGVLRHLFWRTANNYFAPTITTLRS
jgi:hypothetical protein